MSQMCENLHAFADGELAPAEADAFREHLAGCETCQRELLDVLQLQALPSLLEEAKASPAPSPAAAPREQRFRPQWSRRATRVVVGALSLAAALALVVRLVGGQGASAP